MSTNNMTKEPKGKFFNAVHPQILKKLRDFETLYLTDSMRKGSAQRIIIQCKGHEEHET